MTKLRKVHLFKTKFRDIWKRKKIFERSSRISEKFTNFIKKKKKVKQEKLRRKRRRKTKKRERKPTGENTKKTSQKQMQ